MKTTDLIHVLNVSVKKHGDNTPITLGHLLNIAKMINKHEVWAEELEIAVNKDATECALGELG